MGDPATVPQKMTLEEFYDWSDRQEAPYEFVDGVPVPLYPEVDENGVVKAMAAGSMDHHTIQMKAGRLLESRKPTGCRAATGAQTRVGDVQNRVPDAVLWCGPTEKGARTVTDPVVLVEVLSTSTADFDKGQKLDEYLLLPSVREVWLVDSTRRWARIDRRVEGGWFVSDTIGQGGFRSEVLGGEEIPLNELYADTPV